MHGYVQDYGQDPTSLNSQKDDSGVWFNFSRTGTGLDTEYKVEKAQTKRNVDGDIMFVDDRDSLPQNIVQDYENLGYDLFSIYKEKSYDEMKQLFLYNLKAIVEKEPYFAVPGFDNFDDLGETSQAQATTASAQTDIQKGNAANITTKFGAADDDDDDVEERAKPAVEINQVATPQSNDEILAAADDILNSI